MRIFKNTFYIDIYSQIPLFPPTYMHIYKLLYYPLGTITFLVTIHQVCVWISGKIFFFFYVSWLLGVNIVGFKFFFSFFFFLIFCLFLAHCHCNIHTNTEAYGTNRDI